jgi:transcriptional regulator with XRE-family HTH domain
MTQAEVASLAGLSERTLRRMEAGEWDSISKLQAVQKVLEEKGVHFHAKTADAGYGLTMPLWWE